MPEDADPLPHEAQIEASRKPEDRVQARPPKRRRWRRRFLWGLLILFVVAAVFHRPLFHAGVRLILIQVAARQNVTVDAEFSGSIFTNLTVRNVRAYPTGDAPSPIEKITIESLRLEYSLPMLLRHGVGEFLRSYEVKNADLRLLAKPTEDEEERRRKRSLARDLNALLAQPALYADRVRVENFNVRVEAPENVTEVQGVNLFLHPEQLGYLRIAKLQIPDVPTWKNLSAETSYAQRNLYLRNLRLDSQLVINELNFDASQRAQRRGSIMVNATAFGGHVHLWVEGAQLPKKGENLQNSYDTVVRAKASEVDLAALTGYFGSRPLPLGTLKSLHLELSGEPELPRTWTGKVDASLAGLPTGKIAAETIALSATITEGTAQITAGNASAGSSSIALTGKAELPESVNGFPSTNLDARLVLNAPDLLELTKPFMTEQPISGAATGRAMVQIVNGMLTANVNLDATNAAYQEFASASANIRTQFSRDLRTSGESFFTRLQGDISARFDQLRYGTFSADSAVIEGAIENEVAIITAGELVRGENRIELTGTYDLSPDTPFDTPLASEFRLHVPDLGAFGFQLKGETLDGSLMGAGSLKTIDGALSGRVDVSGENLSLGKFNAQRLIAKVEVANGEANIEEIRLLIKGREQIAVTGKLGLAKPLPYEGAFLALINDASVLQPLLAVFGIEEAVAGSIDLSIEGSGEWQPQKHDGELKLAVDKGRYGNVDLKEIRLEGLYSPEFAESTKLRLVSGITSLEGVLEWRNAKLKLRDIDLRQGSMQVLSGYVIIPFDPTNPDNLIALDQRIAANVNARDLDIEKLLTSVGQSSPVSGAITASLLTGGTFLRPSAHLKVSAKKVKSQAAAKLDPAEIELTAHYAENDLTLDLVGRQKQIQPLTIKGRFPLDLESAVKQKRLDPELPLDLTVKLPRSSLAFLQQLVPGIRRLEGTTTIDAKVGGTLEKPRFSGAMSSRIVSVRMEKEAIPTVGPLNADLAFTNEGLQFRTFRGEVGGGTFDVAGAIRVPRWMEPVLDLRLRSDDVLVRRDDSVTVRVDADVRAKGPLALGDVKGTVWVTQSRFFRDIDILPIGLPGRPKPKAPKSAPNTGSFSIDEPLLRDWKFDVAIKTRPNDPFQIRGNLANGSAAIDLKLKGTGEAPYLDGLIRIDNFVASLPFSKLNVTRGFITFSEDAPFEPKLDLLAESEIRDYRIAANIYGAAKDPQLSLTSEPPLPQQDIVSLLATGTTTSELTGSTDVLAGRAAVLLFQELSRKVFKKKGTASNVPVQDRFKLDIGAVDNRTGRQEASASFKLGENLYLVGDVDVTGEFAGRIRYMVRFR